MRLTALAAQLTRMCIKIPTASFTVQFARPGPAQSVAETFRVTAFFQGQQQEPRWVRPTLPARCLQR